MSPAETYRQWLQGLANSGNANAQLGLNVQGDNIDNNMGINSDWLATQQPDSQQLSALSNLVSQYQNTHQGPHVVYGASTTDGQLAPGDGTGAKADLSLYDNNARNLQDLLGRVDTGVNQGKTKNEAQYGQNVENANRDKTTKVNNEKRSKQSALDTIRTNAGQGYHSLAAIIGRAAGRGSSAFRDLLPNVIGKDTSSKTFNASNNYGQNMSNIDTSFEGTLKDLLNQKKANEEKLLSGAETQKQDINSKLASNAIARGQAAGQTPTQALAGAQPFESAITNSRNTVDNYFNQFQPDYTLPTQNPNLAAYQTDRSAVNAQQQGQSTNPYESMLRKRLQGQA